jgi:hypothetical protein
VTQCAVDDAIDDTDAAVDGAIDDTDCAVDDAIDDTDAVVDGAIDDTDSASLSSRLSTDGRLTQEDAIDDTDAALPRLTQEDAIDDTDAAAQVHADDDAIDDTDGRSLSSTVDAASLSSISSSMLSPFFMAILHAKSTGRTGGANANALWRAKKGCVTFPRSRSP